MPIHDWTRVPAGLFHDFHQTWAVQIKTALNAGLLPKGMSALVEQRVGPKEADVLTVESRRPPRRSSDNGPGPAAAPTATIVRRTAAPTPNRANRVAVRHHLGRIVAVIEIVSPANKAGRGAFRDFVEKSAGFLLGGVHLVVLDLFPPTPRDPAGIHKAIWDELHEEEFVPPPGRDRTVVSYEAGPEPTAYIEPLAVGDPLPDGSLFLAPGLHVRVPLEPTYRATWDGSPEDLRTAVETGVMPDPDADD